jgi:hypothetical protein
MVGILSNHAFVHTAASTDGRDAYDLFVYFALMCVTLFQFIFWRCPRCHRFYGRFNYACKHCGLRKWAGNDEEVAEASASDSVIQ